jgi:hypothetical protein
MTEETLPEAPHWTLDPVLQPYFLGAGIILVVCLVLGLLANTFSWNDAMIPVRGWPLWLGGIFVGVTAAGSALFLWLSMLSYSWQVDRRERGIGAFWLGVLFLGNWVGAVIYYFLVFRRIAEKRIGGKLLLRPPAR